MIKKTILSLVCALAAAATSFAQTQSLTLTSGGTSSGTYQSNAVFSLDVNLTFSGYSAYGLSYWLDVAQNANSVFRITGIEYFTFLDPNDTVGNPENFDFALSNGRFATTNDLGATIDNSFVPANAIAPGTYLVTRLQIEVTGAAPGTYTIGSSNVNPRRSLVTDTGFNDNYLPAATYTVTVVPEPSTFALLGVAAVGAGIAAYRRRRLS